MPALDDVVRDAIRHFWATRHGQSARQGGASDRDRGGRAAVTGGKQMDGFVSLVRQLLVEAGVANEGIVTDRRLELPGWFRAEKKWDLIVTHDGELVAAIEFKSHIGPSFGNNFNNRTEEALGSATDIWAAFREGAFRPSARPFLGYLMLLEDAEKSRSAVRVYEPHFEVFPEFREASYRTRYEVLILKLLRERLYDGAAFLISPDQGPETVDYAEPNEELTFERLVTPLLAHAIAITGAA